MRYIDGQWMSEERARGYVERDQARAELESVRQQLQGAVHLTDAERARLRALLHRPVAPGPMKDLDVAILRKLDHPGGQ